MKVGSILIKDGVMKNYLKFSYVLFAVLMFANAEFFNAQVVNRAYQGGEFINFKVRYYIFNSFEVSMKVEEKIYKNKPHYHVTGIGRSVGAARLFFKVEDLYETYIDKETLLPSRFIRKLEEGNYTKDRELLFNHQTQKVKVLDYKANTTNEFKIKEGIQDMLSSFYYLRNIDTDSIRINEFISLEIFMDNEIYPFKVKLLAREKIKTKYGEVSCLKVRPYVSKGDIFREEESVTIWVSDDRNHLPMKIKADLVVGSITAEINEVKKLLNPIGKK